MLEMTLGFSTMTGLEVTAEMSKVRIWISELGIEMVK